MIAFCAALQPAQRHFVFLLLFPGILKIDLYVRKKIRYNKKITGMEAGFMHFTKMQGIGNDYIYVNCFEETVPNPSETGRKISSRHYGVGSDGLVLIEPSDVADFGMRIFNSDGSESEMCGNACRCIGKYVYERGLTDKTSITLMTGSGLKVLDLTVSAGKVVSVRVDMGSPELSPALIPVDLPGEIILGHQLTVGSMPYSIHCVSMGNPHCVIFVRSVDNVDVEQVGSMLENHPIFPHRTNVEFVQLVDRTHLRMRVWERGAGETLACGTGACASLVAAVQAGLCEREATLQLRGGNLHICWDETSNEVLMTGPAAFVFDGVLPD